MNPSSTEAGPIRILVVDDHAVVRAGLRLLLEGHPRCEVVAEAADPDSALQQAASDTVDLVLLDLDLGDRSGLEILPLFAEEAPHVKVLVLTGVRDPEVQRRAIALGAMGLVQKEQAGEVLLKAVECVHAGEVWLDRSTMATVLAEMQRSASGPRQNPDEERNTTLTVREREVVALMCEGLRNRQIAERMFIGESTVRHHLTSIFGKLEVADRLELVIYAYRTGLTKPPESKRKGE